MRAGLALGVSAAAIALVASACAAVLGFEDTTLRSDAVDAAGGGSSDAGSEEPALEIRPKSVLLRRAGKLDLTVTVRRGLTVSGPVAVRLEDLPPGVTAAPVTIDPASTAATLTVTAAPDATLGRTVAHLRADAALLGALDVPISVADPAGSLDVTFDGDGLVSDSTRGLGGTFFALAGQSDGKIVAGGAGATPPGWMVRRFLPDGTPEASFDSAASGLPGSGEVRAIAIDGSGRVLLAGSSLGLGKAAQLTVVRLLPSGAVDASFAGGAYRLTVADGLLGSTAYAIAVQPDGDVVVAGARREGAALDGGAPELTGIAIRLKPDGTRDAAFGSGLVSVKQNRFVGVSIDDNGSIVLAGTDSSRAQPSYFLTRRTPQGQVDTSFGVNGTLDFGLGFRANGLTRLAGGFGVVGDSVSPGDPRYTAGLSAASGAQIWLQTAPGPSAAYFAAASDDGGRMIATGHTPHEARVDVLFADGGRDDSFSDGGTAFVDPPGPGGFTVSLFAAAVPSDGRILVAGNRSNAGAVVYRLWP